MSIPGEKRGMGGGLQGRPCTLDKWQHTRAEHHKALLLFAMQAPGLRSNRSVGRAIGKSGGCMRNWRREGCWAQRIEAHGPDADQYALDQYRALYLEDYGQLELPHVAKNIVRQMGGLARLDPGAKAAHDARIAAAGATPRAMLEAEQAVGQAIATYKRDTRADAKKHIRLVDASLGLIAKKLKAQEVRVSVRDIPVLLECRERLVQAMAGAQPGDSMGGKLVESARVKQAKQHGGDVLTAMFEDAEELVVILGALKTSKEADLAALAAADEQARDAEAGKQA